MAGEKGLFCGINKPKDEKNLTELERKHIPVIEAPSSVKAGEHFEVTIIVGEIPHVMEEGHHIRWVELYSRGDFLARVDFTPVFKKAEVKLMLVKGQVHGTTTLRAVERCNLHGMWEDGKRSQLNKMPVNPIKGEGYG